VPGPNLSCLWRRRLVIIIHVDGNGLNKRHHQGYEASHLFLSSLSLLSPLSLLSLASLSPLSLRVCASVCANLGARCDLGAFLSLSFLWRRRLFVIIRVDWYGLNERLRQGCEASSLSLSLSLSLFCLLPHECVCKPCCAAGRLLLHDQALPVPAPTRGNNV